MLKSAFGTIAFSYAAAATSFAIQFWLADTMSTLQYGLFATGLLVGNVMQVILVFGTDRTLVRDLVQSDEPSQVFVDSVALRLILVMVLLPICLVSFVLTAESKQAAWTLVFGGSYGALLALTPMGWYDSRKKMHVQTFLTFIEKLIFAGIVAGAVIIAGVMISPVFAAGALFVAALVTILLQWLLIVKEVRSFRPQIGFRREVHHQFKENLPVSIAAMGNLGMTHANQFILLSLAGKASLAHYSIPFGFVRVVRLFLAQYVRIFAPEIAAMTTDENIQTGAAQKCFLRHIFISFVAATAIGVAVFFAGRFAILNYLPKYKPSIPILMALSLWCSVMGPAMVINRFLLCVRLEKYFFYSAVIFGLFAIALGCVLIPWLHGVGAALTLVISHALSAAFQAVVTVRKMRGVRFQFMSTGS